MSANVWRNDWNHNKQGAFPAFYACICSHLSSRALFWPNTHRHPANLCLQHLTYLAIKAVPDSIGARVWFWYSGPWCSKAICSNLNSFFSCLMGIHLNQTGTTGYSSNQERTWLQLLPPTHVQLHTTKTTHTHTVLSQAMLPLSGANQTFITTCFWTFNNNIFLYLPVCFLSSLQYFGKKNESQYEFCQYRREASLSFSLSLLLRSRSKR